MIKRCERCGLCGLFGCIHIHPNRSFFINSDISLGESIGEPMSNIVAGKTSTPEEKVIISPLPALPNIPSSSVFKDALNTGLSKSDEFVKCNLCNARVQVKYLDKHSKAHIICYKPEASSSTAIVPVNKPNYISQVPATPANDPENPKIEKIETYRFRTIDEACMASSVSKNGRYSDITIVFWEKEKAVVETQKYTNIGNSYSTNKDWERFQVHIVYDSVEEFYTVSCKLIKRTSTYNPWDNEDSVPDRICEQKDLLGEIKRAMLFFRISPKIAYRHFRKILRQNIIVSYDESGKAIVAKTANCDKLMERLNRKGTGYSASSYAEHYDY